MFAREIETLAGRYRRGLGAWVRIMARYAGWVVAAAALMTALAVHKLATDFRINTDNEDMLSAELPFRQDSRALSGAFPDLSDNIVIVVEAPSS